MQVKYLPVICICLYLFLSLKPFIFSELFHINSNALRHLQIIYSGESYLCKLIELIVLDIYFRFLYKSLIWHAGATYFRELYSVMLCPLLSTNHFGENMSKV